MSFFQNLFDGISRKVSEYNEKKREKEQEENLRREQRLIDRIELEKAFKIAAKKAAIIKAQRDANRMTGLAKLRAEGRVETLKKDKEPFLSRLSEYMHNNIQRREENLKRTGKLRQAAKQDKLGKEVQKYRQPFSDLKKLRKP